MQVDLGTHSLKIAIEALEKFVSIPYTTTSTVDLQRCIEYLKSTQAKIDKAEATLTALSEILADD